MKPLSPLTTRTKKMTGALSSKTFSGCLSESFSPSWHCVSSFSSEHQTPKQHVHLLNTTLSCRSKPDSMLDLEHNLD